MLLYFIPTYEIQQPFSNFSRLLQRFCLFNKKTLLKDTEGNGPILEGGHSSSIE